MFLEYWRRKMPSCREWYIGWSYEWYTYSSFTILVYRHHYSIDTDTLLKATPKNKKTREVDILLRYLAFDYATKYRHHVNISRYYDYAISRFCRYAFSRLARFLFTADGHWSALCHFNSYWRHFVLWYISDIRQYRFLFYDLNKCDFAVMEMMTWDLYVTAIRIISEPIADGFTTCRFTFASFIHTCSAAAACRWFFEECTRFWHYFHFSGDFCISSKPKYDYKLLCASFIIGCDARSFTLWTIRSILHDTPLSGVTFSRWYRHFDDAQWLAFSHLRYYFIIWLSSTP